MQNLDLIQRKYKLLFGLWPLKSYLDFFGIWMKTFVFHAKNTSSYKEKHKFVFLIQNKNKYFFAGAKSLDRTIEALFAEVDLNGDGKIQPSEFDTDLA